MKRAPALAAQAANHACGGGEGQWDQECERGEAYRYKPALQHIFPHFRPVEKFVQANPSGEVQAGVEKREQPEHAAKANELRLAKKLAKRRDGQSDDDEADGPVAGAVSNKFDRVRAEIHVVREAGKAMVECIPQKDGERNAT